MRRRGQPAGSEGLAVRSSLTGSRAPVSPPRAAAASCLRPGLGEPTASGGTSTRAPSVASQRGYPFVLMESVPQGLVLGLVLPQAPPGVELPELPEITFERLSALFSELALSQGYRNFQNPPDGSCLIYGLNANDKLMIRPGLVQVTDPAAEGAQRAADRASQVIKAAITHLGIVNILQLGVKWVFNVPCPEGARHFALEKLARTTEELLEDLAVGSSVWAGVHYMTTSEEKSAQYSIRVEPLLADDAFLFVNVDTGFSNVQIAAIGETIREVLAYAQGPVMAHINNLRG